MKNKVEKVNVLTRTYKQFCYFKIIYRGSKCASNTVVICMLKNNMEVFIKSGKSLILDAEVVHLGQMCKF